MWFYMEYTLKENERIDDLQINNLKIIQNKNWFCYGIDSVLLSDYAKKIKNNSKILDLGTGTGIISILLTAKINPQKIIGVEIQKEIAEMAQRSVILNNLEDKISILNEDIKNLDKILEKEYYDAIVTNPPYMKADTGLKNENMVKSISRHEIECTIEDIAKISYKLLRNNGEIYMVHRPDRLVDIMEIFRRYKLEVKELRIVYPKENSQANLLLIKAVKNAKSFLKINKPLYVYKQDGSYTDEILEIYNKSKVWKIFGTLREKDSIWVEIYIW